MRVLLTIASSHLLQGQTKTRGTFLVVHVDFMISNSMEHLGTSMQQGECGESAMRALCRHGLACLWA